MINTNLNIVWELWSDPGAYPNALASGPLPNRWCPSYIEGTITIEKEHGMFPALERIPRLIRELADYPANLVTAWDIDNTGERIVLAPTDWNLDNVKPE
jgi:hypothetical protein